MIVINIISLHIQKELDCTSFRTLSVVLHQYYLSHLVCFDFYIYAHEHICINTHIQLSHISHSDGYVDETSEGNVDLIIRCTDSLMWIYFTYGLHVD